jgi:hypothetical protein
MLSAMPRPRSEREQWKEERAEIPAQIAALQRDLDATPATHSERCEGLTWKIRRAEQRLAELDARLARATAKP